LVSPHAFVHRPIDPQHLLRDFPFGYIPSQSDKFSSSHFWFDVCSAWLQKTLFSELRVLFPLSRDLDCRCQARCLLSWGSLPSVGLIINPDLLESQSGCHQSVKASSTWLNLEADLAEQSATPVDSLWRYNWPDCPPCFLVRSCPFEPALALGP
jgi:hypothetical protein